MDVVGQWSVQANYGQQSKTLPLIVVTGMARASLEEIGYSIYASTGRRSEKITAEQTPGSIGSLLIKHAAIFRNELGTIQPFKATPRVKENAAPRFYKA